MHREIHKSRHITVLILATIIFFLGILVGAQVEQFRLEKIEAQFKEQSRLSEEMQAEIEFIDYLISIHKHNETNCRGVVSSFLESIQKLDNVVFSLERYESSAIARHDEYLELKESYFNLQTRYYILANRINSLCPNSFDTILYFYTYDRDCPECEDQGLFLSHIKRKHTDNVMIFSYNIQSESTIVSILTQTNSIKSYQTPTLIINSKHKLGFSNVGQIEKYLEVSVKN
ncbi:MAG: hypothetical protein ACMXYB_01120 [Candidatus Woesearchaeota archaeon]